MSPLVFDSSLIGLVVVLVVVSVSPPVPLVDYPAGRTYVSTLLAPPTV